MTRLALVADLDRCTGCFSCVVACKEEYRLPAGVSYIRLLQVGPDGEFPALSMYYVPVACQQCEKPSCAEACPEEAIARTDAGLVRVDEDRCTGCGDCVDACPYDAIAVDSARGVACKCELCWEQLTAGRMPVCVAACPGKALWVVDLDEEQLPSARVLGPESGNKPCGRFLLTCQEWRGGPEGLRDRG